MELAEAAHDLEENAYCTSQFETALLRPLEELRNLRNGRRLAPVSRQKAPASFEAAGRGVRCSALAHSGSREKAKPLNPVTRLAFAGWATEGDRPSGSVSKVACAVPGYCETQPFRKSQVFTVWVSRT